MAFRLIRFRYDIFNYDRLSVPKELIANNEDIIPLGVMYRRVVNDRTNTAEKLEAFCVRYKGDVYAAVGMTEAQFNGGATGSYPVTMTTENGEETPSYPVGVFNVDGSYIGVANNNTEYVTLWNGDAVNQRTGTISDTGVSKKFTLVKKKESWDGKLIGKRYFQFTAANGLRFITTRDVHIDFGDGVVVPAYQSPLIYSYTAWKSAYGTVPPTPQSFRSLQSDYTWTVDEMAVDVGQSLYTKNECKGFYVGKNIGGAELTIRVFHNEEGGLLLWDVTGYWGYPDDAGRTIKNISGNLPKHLTHLRLMFWNMIGSGINFNNTNFAELDSLQGFTASTWAYQDTRSLFPASINNLKSTLIQFQTQMSSSGLDGWGIDASWTALRSLNPIWGCAPFTNFVANPPKGLDYGLGISNGSSRHAFSSAMMDSFVIGVEPVLSNKKQVSAHKVLSLFYANPYVSSADGYAALAKLLAAGWRIWF